MSRTNNRSLQNAVSTAVKPIGRRPRLALQPVSDLPIPVGDRDQEDLKFLPAAVEILEARPSRFMTGMGYAICLGLSVALVLSCFVRLPVYAIATGKIQTIDRTKVVQPSAKGQVVAIRAKDGDRVNKGDVLVELNTTEPAADEKIIADQLVNVQADSQRFRVELKAVDEKPINVHPAVSWEGSIPAAVRTREEEVLNADLSQFGATIADLTAQRQAQEVAKAKFSSSIQAQKALIDNQTDRTAIHEKLQQQGWDSKAKLLEAQQPLQQERVDLSTLERSLAGAVSAIAVLDSEITKDLSAFKADKMQALADADRHASELTQQLAKATKAVADMTLRSPDSGIVQGTAVTTLGQEVRAGQQLMQIVPDGQPLVVEAYVLNSDFGFVKEGQPATIKVESFPYTRYGTIAGTVTRVAADAIPGQQALELLKNGSLPTMKGPLSATNATESTSDLVFPIGVALSKSSIDVGGRPTPLSSGMSVVVEVETGTQRIIEYILYPLARGMAPSGRSHT